MRTSMEQLVARLSLEPGLRTVHWHSADESDLPPALAAPAAESASPRNA
jgi:hypothetical protein